MEEQGKLISLPAELRFRIWFYVYGGTVHIARKERSMRCAICSGPALVRDLEESGINQDAHGRMITSLVKEVVQCTCLRTGVEPRMHARRRQDVIRTERESMIKHEAPISGLYRACRQTYNETIDLVYTTPTFALPTQISLKHFADTIPAARLSQIRSLHLYVHFDSWISRSKCGWHGLSTDYEAQRELPEACEVLKSMNGLREVIIILRFGGGAWRHGGLWSFFAEGCEFRETVKKLGKVFQGKAIKGILCPVIESREHQGHYMAWEEVRKESGDLHDMMGPGWDLGRWIPAGKDNATQAAES